MTASRELAHSSPSRRAVLAGGLTGLGAVVLGAIGRARPVRAADGNVIHVGDDLTASSFTRLTNDTDNDTVLWAASNGSGYGLRGDSNSGGGVYGTSGGGYGVGGLSEAGYGVTGVSIASVGARGSSNSNIGVVGVSSAGDHPGVLGRSEGHSTGVQGHSGVTLTPSAKAKTGVFGYAGQDTGSRGVWGESPAGRAIQGTTTSGYAGYFSGKVYTTKWYEMSEVGAPSAPASNRARLFVRDNGSGKTQLCVRFSTGAVQVLATQP